MVTGSPKLELTKAGADTIIVPNRKRGRVHVRYAPALPGTGRGRIEQMDRAGCHKEVSEGQNINHRAGDRLFINTFLPETGRYAAASPSAWASPGRICFGGTNGTGKREYWQPVGQRKTEQPRQ